MNPEQQRIAIAEACGLKCVSDGITHCLTPCVLGTGKYDPEGKGLTYVPDYLNDLNAMHEALGKVMDENLFLYDLDQIIWEERATRELVSQMDRLKAKPSQLAKALLKTLNLWKDND